MLFSDPAGICKPPPIRRTRFADAGEKGVPAMAIGRGPPLAIKKPLARQPLQLTRATAMREADVSRRPWRNFRLAPEILNPRQVPEALQLTETVFLTSEGKSSLSWACQELTD